MRPGDRWSDGDFIHQRPSESSDLLVVRYDLGNGRYLLADFALPRGSDGSEPDLKLQVKSVVDFEDLRPLIAPELYPYVRCVHLSATFECFLVWENFDPADLIRAVNALQRLDKQTALSALEAYHKLATTDRDRQNRYDLVDGKIIPITRLLFVRTDGDPTMPWVLYGAPDVHVERGDQDWPLFPLIVGEDVPFVLVEGYSGAGTPESSARHIDYCRAHCQIRRAPLTPASPLQAAERITRSERWRRLFAASRIESEEITARFRLRVQARRAVESLVPDLPDAADLDPYSERFASWEASIEQAERVWNRMLNDPRLKNVQWDAKVDNFAIAPAGEPR
jgi:hypothetical protein